MPDDYQWHLDGWDRQAGRAFATRRSRGAELGENRADWGPTVYIAPPDFRPEQIGSTSIALAAARAAYFDESVPPNANAENELSFPSADAVAEFVRRAFVGSGRNRGGGGGGGEGPTDRNPPQSPEGERQENDALWSYLYDAEELRTRLQGTRTVSALPIPSLAQTFAHGVREEGIESGALQLTATLLETQASGNLDVVWPSANTTLHRAMVELQIWQEWLQRPDDDPRTIRNARYLWDPVSALIELPVKREFAGNNASRVIATAHYLCSLPFARLLPQHVEYARFLFNPIYSSQYPLYTYAAFGMPPDSFDRFGPMFSWPLPAYVTGKDRAVASVGALLMAFIASPARVARWSGATDIVLFAAALLASRVEDRAAPNWRGRAAANWLAGSVPTHVFSEDIEALIWEPERVREFA